MTDDPLLLAIRAVPMRCADCGDTTHSCGHGAAMTLITDLRQRLVDAETRVREVEQALRSLLDLAKRARAALAEPKG